MEKNFRPNTFSLVLRPCRKEDQPRMLYNMRRDNNNKSIGTNPVPIVQRALARIESYWATMSVAVQSSDAAKVQKARENRVAKDKGHTNNFFPARPPSSRIPQIG